MEEWIEIRCPSCGAVMELELEPGHRDLLTQTCQACGRPFQLTVSRDEWGDPDVKVDRAG